MTDEHKEYFFKLGDVLFNMMNDFCIKTITFTSASGETITLTLKTNDDHNGTRCTND